MRRLEGFNAGWFDLAAGSSCKGRMPPEDFVQGLVASTAALA